MITNLIYLLNEIKFNISHFLTNKQVDYVIL